MALRKSRFRDGLPGGVHPRSAFSDCRAPWLQNHIYLLLRGTYHSQEKPLAQPVMHFVCKYSSRPRAPYSFPKPLLLKPPKVLSTGSALEQFFHTMPACSACATRSQRASSLEITPLPRP